MYEQGSVRRQIGLFLLGVLVAAACSAIRWGLHRARMAAYERIDERIAALLDRGDVQQARRLVNDAIESCRRLGSMSPSVYAAAAILYGPNGLNNPVTSARYMEAALEGGLSLADRPTLRTLYARDLAALKRWSDLVELYSTYPQETLFAEEHRLLVRALLEVGLTNRAYEAVLRALACPLDPHTTRTFWKLRGELATQLGLVDCWAGIDGASLSAETILTLAECELKRVTVGPEGTIRSARRLLARFSGRPELLARARALLFLLLRDSDMVAAARKVVHAAWAGEGGASSPAIWLELLDRECGREEPDAEILSELILAVGAYGPANTRARDIVERAVRLYAIRSLKGAHRLDARTVEAAIQILGGPKTADCFVDSVVAAAEGGERLDGMLDEVYRLLCSLAIGSGGTWRFRLASMFAERGDYRRAVELISPNGETLGAPDQLLTAARWCRAAGRWDVQTRLATRALELAEDPGLRLRAQLELGMGRIRAGAYREAEEILSSALSEAIFAPAQERKLVQELRVALALALAGQGKTRSALGFLEEWIEQGGQGSARAHYLYALLLYADVERTYKLGSLSPSLPGGNAQAYSERVRSRWLRVAEVLSGVLGRFGAQLAPEELDQLRVAAARTFVALGDHERALRFLEPIAQSSSPWAFEAALECANCLWLLGRREEAQAYLARLSRRADRLRAEGLDEKPQVVPIASSTLRRLF